MREGEVIAAPCLCSWANSRGDLGRMSRIDGAAAGWSHRRGRQHPWGDAGRSQPRSETCSSSPGRGRPRRTPRRWGKGPRYGI
ncbi:hypothetical protein A7982_13114 [Minicystis rosea]|nr:hypothetical protein A7982_13114 [Minicystis rosea]